MKTDIYSLFTQIEATEDIEESIDGSHAILTSGVTPALYEGNKVSRDLDKPYFGGDAQINVNPHLGLQFSVEAAGAGAVDTLVDYDALLRVCGLTPTVNAGTDVTYHLIHQNIQTLTAYFLRGTQLHKTTGVRGNMSLELSSGQLPKIMFDKFFGTYYTPETVVEITPDYSGFQVPNAVTEENTSKINIDGYDACFNKFSLNMNNDVIRQNIPGCRKTIIKNRNPSGQMVVIAPDLATKNFFSSLESHAGLVTVPISVQHGQSAGNIISVSGGQIQLQKISETDVNGELGYQIDYTALPSSAGNDEFVLVTK